MRYETWSGRIACEFFISIFSLLPLFIWRILNTVVVLGLLIYISKIIKISILKENNEDFEKK